MEYYILLQLLIKSFGYLGVLISSAILSSTILLPYPAGIISVLAGAALNPYLIGIFAGVGAGLGEMVGYGLGFGGKKLLEKKLGKKTVKKEWVHMKKLFHKYGGVIIFLGAAIPFPFDVLGMFCGAIHYDAKKFFILTACGKIIQHTIFAVTGNAIISLF